MAFKLTDPLEPPPKKDKAAAQIEKWVDRLCFGGTKERTTALRNLIRVRAEGEFEKLLTNKDHFLAELASYALTECWLNERGRKAAESLDKGAQLMTSGKFEASEKIFLALMSKYPDWAEARFKQATLLFLRDQYAVCSLVCEEVVRLKPIHFSAWNALSICSSQLGKWAKAVVAARRAVSIYPSAGLKGVLQAAETKASEHGIGPDSIT
ncbi:MAG: hypothetical protein FJ405_11925 [Verrucomicrobia bacterium]|nr:hypothetical protein [Verrucomicrobiota bacterium]